jgi:outer membrane protein OmpA-like peptidoglycan-associated protein
MNAGRYVSRYRWIPVVLTVLFLGSGCASRGFVRNEVGVSSESLSASIDENREGIDRTQQDLAALETATREADAEQAAETARVENLVATASEEVEEVRQIAVEAGGTAGSADERSLTLARMFRDRGLFSIEESREIFFGFASAAIDSDHSATLEEVSGMLRSDPDAILVLEGRTDATGDPAFNERLGRERVEAARTYLVMEMGVPVYRIHGFSYGEARPEYDNEVAEERQKNRSVRLLVLSPTPDTSVASLPE